MLRSIQSACVRYSWLMAANLVVSLCGLIGGQLIETALAEGPSKGNLATRQQSSAGPSGSAPSPLSPFADEPPPRVTWVQGRELTRLLEQQVSLGWTGITRRAALKRIAELERLAIAVDRRVDLDHELTLAASDRTFRTSLQELLGPATAVIVVEDRLVYCGPVVETTRLASTLKSTSGLAGQPRSPGAKGQRPRRSLQNPPDDSQRVAVELAWPDAITPRSLLEQLAAQAGCELHGLDQLPHDLWAAGRWPPLPAATAAIVILNQYDLTIDFEQVPESSSRDWTIIASPASESVTRELSLPAGLDADEVRRQAALAHVEVEVENGRVKASGSEPAVDQMLEAVRKLADQRRPPRGKRSRPSDTPVWTLKARGPLGEVLAALRKQGVMLEYDPAELTAAGIDLQRVAEIDAARVTLAELLDRLLDSSGIQYTIQGDSGARLTPR